MPCEDSEPLERPRHQPNLVEKKLAVLYEYTIGNLAVQFKGQKF